MSEIDSLVKMANQIAQNFAFHDDAEDRIADHLQRFWAPAMRRSLKAYARDGGEGLSPGVLSAMQKVDAPE